MNFLVRAVEWAERTADRLEAWYRRRLSRKLAVTATRAVIRMAGERRGSPLDDDEQGALALALVKWLDGRVEEFMAQPERTLHLFLSEHMD